MSRARYRATARATARYRATARARARARDTARARSTALTLALALLHVSHTQTRDTSFHKGIPKSA